MKANSGPGKFFKVIALAVLLSCLLFSQDFVQGSGSGENEYELPENALVFLDIDEAEDVEDSVGFTMDYLFDCPEASAVMNDYIIGEGMDDVFYQTKGVGEDEWQAVFDTEMGHPEIVDLITKEQEIDYYDYMEGETEKGTWMIEDIKKGEVTFVENEQREGVEITVYEDEAREEQISEEIITDDNGEASKELKHGEYWFTAVLEDHQDYEGDLIYEGSFKIEAEDKEVSFTMDLADTVKVENAEELNWALEQEEVETIVFIDDISNHEFEAEIEAQLIDGAQYELEGDLIVTADNVHLRDLVITGDLDKQGDNITTENVEITSDGGGGNLTLDGAEAALYDVEVEGQIEGQGSLEEYQDLLFYDGVLNLNKLDWFDGEEAIQEAVDEVDVAGDTLLVGSGEYEESVTIEAENLTLKSVKEQEAVIDAKGSGQALWVDGVDGVEINGFTIKNFIYEGIYFDEGQEQEGSNDIRVLHNHIKNGLYGILTVDSTDVYFADNRLENNQKAGIYVTHTESVTGTEITAVENSIDSETGLGIEIEEPIEDSNLNLKQNQVDVNQEGIRFADELNGNHIVLENNSIKAIEEGIYFSDYIEESHIYIQDNSVEAVEDEGIEFNSLLTDVEAEVKNNEIVTHDDEGIEFDEMDKSAIDILNNEIVTYDDEGIEFDDISESDMNIYGNEIEVEDTRDGIEFDDEIIQSTVNLENNQVETLRRGIEFDDSIIDSTVTINDNEIVAGSVGLEFDDSDQSNVSIKGNNIIAEEGSIYEDDGIYFDEVKDSEAASLVEIRDNTITGNHAGTGFGVIALGSVESSITVKNNELANNLTGIEIPATQTDLEEKLLVGGDEEEEENYFETNEVHARIHLDDKDSIERIKDNNEFEEEVIIEEEPEEGEFEIVDKIVETYSISAEDTGADAGEEGEILVIAEDKFGNPVEGEEIEIKDDDGLDGINEGDTDITDEEGRVTFEFNEGTLGGYDVVFAAEDKEITDTALVSVYEVLTTFEEHYDEDNTTNVMSVAFSSDDDKVVSGSRDETAKVWDAETGEEKVNFEGHGYDVFSVAFSSDDDKVVSGSRDETAMIWDAETGEEELTFEEHGGVWSVDFSSDDEKVVSGSGDETAMIWDAETAEVETTFREHDDFVASVVSVAFSSDDEEVVSGSRDDTARIWDAETGEERLIFDKHDGSVYSAFSLDDEKVVSGGSDTVRIWDAETGEVEVTFEEHESFIRSVDFSPDDRRVVSGSSDETVKIWDAETGELEAKFEEHPDRVESVTFSSCGTKVVSGDSDGIAKVWDTGLKAPVFEVDITGVNDPIKEGETLEVDLEVKNTGDIEGTQDMKLEKNSETLDAQEVEGLGAGETANITLAWETEINETGEYRLEVNSYNDREWKDVEVTARKEKVENEDELNDALDDESISTVILANDIELTQVVEIDRDKVTLDLNNNNLNNYGVLIEGEYVTIMDGGIYPEEGQGTTGTDDQYDAAIGIEQGGNTVLDNISVAYTWGGNPVHVTNMGNAELKIEDSGIDSGEGEDVAGIYFTAGRANLTGNIFAGDRGVVFGNYADVKIEDVSGNKFNVENKGVNYAADDFAPFNYTKPQYTEHIITGNAYAEELAAFGEEEGRVKFQHNDYDDFHEESDFETKESVNGILTALVTLDATGVDAADFNSLTETAVFELMVASFGDNHLIEADSIEETEEAGEYEVVWTDVPDPDEAAVRVLDAVIWHTGQRGIEGWWEE